MSAHSSRHTTGARCCSRVYSMQGPTINVYVCTSIGGKLRIINSKAQKGRGVGGWGLGGCLAENSDDAGKLKHFIFRARIQFVNRPAREQQEQQDDKSLTAEEREREREKKKLVIKPCPLPSLPSHHLSPPHPSLFSLSLSLALPIRSECWRAEQVNDRVTAA